jgi:small subunit ribosomal protein S4
VSATRRHGVTGEILLQLLEARLDNTVYRLGISPTRRGARQLVGHRHVTVNGKVLNIPSYSCKPGDIIAVRGKSKGLEIVTTHVGAKTNNVRQFGWLEWNVDKMQGVFLAYPQRDQIPENINEQLIVELYSK